MGELVLGAYDEKLCLCDWRYRTKRNEIDNRISEAFNTNYKEGSSSIIEATIDQLEGYFKKTITTFDIPLLQVGTDFQKEVWRKLLEIPYGETQSYLHLSKNMGNPKAIRAIASANGANAISILIPCHRIIGSNGELVGYAGGLQAKKTLLELEGSFA